MSDLQPVIDDLRKQASTLTTSAAALNKDADALAAYKPPVTPPTPIEPPVQPPTTQQTLGQRYGAFSMPLEQVQGVADSFLAQQGDILKDVGVGWWRGDYPVRQVSPSKGVYNWSDTDRWVKVALTRGIKPLPILYMLPQWMNNASNDKNPPVNDADYADWCSKAATHLWNMGVTAVELWNEQNLSGFWTGQPSTDDAYRGKYTRMMKAAYPAIKAAVPGMIVVSGGLSTADTVFQSTGQPNPPGCGALSTIESYGQKGLFSYCDAVGWHPYLDTDVACKDVGNWPSWSPKAVAAALASIDKYAPGRGVSLWTTETGCPRSAVGGNQGEQSKRAQDAIKVYLPGGCLNQYANRLGPFFWFCAIDRNTGDAREDSFGWQSRGGNKYQIYPDMKQAMAVAWPG